MNINHLIYFHALAKTKNFSTAAERCYTTQPNLSYGIHALEDELGIFLFNRSKRRVELTQAGELYLPYVSAALQELERGDRMLQIYKAGGKDEELLRIGGRRLNYFGNIISDFLNSSENNNIRYEMFDYSFDIAQDHVLNHDLDIATGAWNPKKQHPDLVYIPIKLPDMVLVVDPQHPLAELESVTLWQIKEYGLIRKTGNGSMNREIDALYEKAGFEPMVASRVSTQFVVLATVESRMGIALVADTRDINSFRVKKLCITWPKQDYFYCICFRKNTPMSMAAQVTCAYIINKYGIHPKESLAMLYKTSAFDK